VKKSVTTWSVYRWGFQSFPVAPATSQNGDPGAARANLSHHLLGFVDPLTGDEHRFLMDDDIRARIVMAMLLELDDSSKHRIVHFLVGAPEA